jgi:arylsulfatase A
MRGSLALRWRFLVSVRQTLGGDWANRARLSEEGSLSFVGRFPALDWKQISHCFLILLTFFPAGCGQFSAAAQPAAVSKPNFVLFLSDDLGYGDVEPFGSVLNRTPNLDRMAREGMRLTSFYGCPVCTPSRVQFMTGCYAKRVSMPNVIFPSCPTGLSTDEHTVAKLLKAQGYSTMCIGKWHLGDQREFLPTRHGFDHYFGLPYSNDMGGGEEDPKKNERPPLPLLRDETVVEAPAVQDTLTARYTEEAVRFITGNQSKPFFLYLPHTAVHVPLHPGRNFRGRSKNGTYGDWVEELDWSAGRILDTLRILGIASRTLVLFTSDNGPWLTQGKNGGIARPLRGGKGSTWEGGMREPTIAWWPGHIPPGSECSATIANIDVLPTFVKLAGGQVPRDRDIDGQDISPLLLRQSKESPHEAFFYFRGETLEAVRSGPWKLALPLQLRAEYRQEQALPPVKLPRLYNLERDIGETKDVAAKHPDIVRRLAGYIAEMDADLGQKQKGPGVRPPGRVANPRPLLKE